MIKNKKAISEIVSYVLLIIIAVSISGIVYSFLVKYIPKGELAECPEDVSIAAREISCDSEYILTINITNRGLWNISAVDIKAGDPARRIKPLIKKENFAPPLAPGETIEVRASTTQIVAGDLELQLQPSVISPKDQSSVLCPKAIITQPFSC